ncbi:MAG TPA: heme NO-binding domain-containing protein [Actinomycetota bacterium]|nr:heme NO-binding domain-containing protein [Actinomycetota bacterium]
MKGIIFNLLEHVVVRDHGEQMWDAILDDAGVDGVYTAVGTYPDEELGSLVQASAERLGSTRQDIQRWLGREAFPELVDRYPVFFDGHSSARSFILTLNDVIHPEVRKLFPGAYAPTFRFDDSRPDELRLTYDSYRRMCFFAEGLVEGTANHFKEDLGVEQLECIERGDPHCTLRITFEG